MSDEQEYKRFDFINNLVKPWNELASLLLKPYSLDPKFSDPIISGRSLAIATAHQFDAYKSETGIFITDAELLEASKESMRIKDLSNTIKHVTRTRGHSAEINGISAQVILNDEKKFCFLRNQIIYNHENDGECDLLDDIQKSIYYWAEKRGIDISMIENWSGSPISIQPAAPSDAITLFYDPKICIHQKSQGLKLFKVDETGQLEPTDHDEITFQVISVNQLQPFASIELLDRNISGAYISKS